MIGVLRLGEKHPATEYARTYLLNKSLHQYIEPFASCAIEGNRLAEICGETLRRILDKEPVSDRYLMGLAWAIWQMEDSRLQTCLRKSKRKLKCK